MFSVVYGEVKSVELLLRYKTNLSLVNYRETALDVARGEDNDEIMKLLKDDLKNK